MQNLKMNESNGTSRHLRKKLLASAVIFSSFFTVTIIGSALSFANSANAQTANPQTSSIDTKAATQQLGRNILTKDEIAKLKASATSSARFDTERDAYRHPVETLEFFGIKPNATVVEVWPGQGWYTSILAPYLKSGNGHLIAAHFDTTTTSSDLVKKVVESYSDTYGGQPGLYGDVKIVPFGPRSGNLAPDNSVDAVLTFRNIHNWMAQGWTEKAFKDFYTALKPGGILGIEEHRADNTNPQDPMAADGYVREDYIIDLAKDAGFELVDASEINANPRDTRDHPFGVWTLPPVLRTAPMGQTANPKFDNARYKAIGESDRSTLLFRKPLAPPVTATALASKEPKPVIMTFAPPPPPVATKKPLIKNPFAKKEEVKASTETAKQEIAASTTPIISSATNPVAVHVPLVESAKTPSVETVKQTFAKVVDAKTPTWSKAPELNKTDVKVPVKAAEIKPEIKPEVKTALADAKDTTQQTVQAAISHTIPVVTAPAIVPSVSTPSVTAPNVVVPNVVVPNVVVPGTPTPEIVTAKTETPILPSLPPLPDVNTPELNKTEANPVDVKPVLVDLRPTTKDDVVTEATQKEIKVAKAQITAALNPTPVTKAATQAKAKTETQIKESVKPAAKAEPKKATATKTDTNAKEVTPKTANKNAKTPAKTTNAKAETAKADVKTGTKIGAKTTTSKAATNADAKKANTKTTAKKVDAETKPATKATGKTTTKTETKPGTKAAAKTDTKTTTKAATNKTTGKTTGASKSTTKKSVPDWEPVKKK